LEQDLAEKEKQYEELVEKFNASKAELEELSRQFEDL
jgi:tropomyosin